MASERVRSAFSLVELLFVVAIIVVLTGLSITGFNSILKSSRMDQAGRTLLDEINLARQLASARNQNVELRFIRRPRTDGSGADIYWQLQSGLLSVTDSSTNFSPLRSVASLPLGTALEPNVLLSPLLAQGQEKSHTNPDYKFVALTVRPTGEVELVNTPPVNALPQWCLTIVPERHLGQPLSEIADFVTIQIDPLTSRPRSYRP